MLQMFEKKVAQGCLASLFQLAHQINEACKTLYFEFRLMRSALRLCQVPRCATQCTVAGLLMAKLQLFEKLMPRTMPEP